MVHRVFSVNKDVHFIISGKNKLMYGGDFIPSLFQMS